MNLAKDLFLALIFIVILVNYVLLYRKMIKERDYFINTLSHDLRVSTIAQIRGLDLLEKDSNNNELLTEIKKSCNFTFDMINTLLSTYKYENGDEVLNYETFKLKDMILSICNRMFSNIVEKGLKLSCKLDSKIDIQADKIGIEKAFFILLSFAVFNAKRNSSINISTRNKKDNIEISIDYKGRFLTDEEQRRMYLKKSRFSTVGEGIRMHFCKKIIDFHKGYLSIKKYENESNSFCFSIPINRRKGICKIPLISFS